MNHYTVMNNTVPFHTKIHISAPSTTTVQNCALMMSLTCTQTQLMYTQKSISYTGNVFGKIIEGLLEQVWVSSLNECYYATVRFQSGLEKSIQHFYSKLILIFTLSGSVQS